MVLRSIWFRVRLSMWAAVATVLLAASGPAQIGDVGDKISGILEGNAANFDTRELDLAALRAFYASRSFEPAWTNTPRADQDAHLAIDTLDHAGYDGLETDKYHLRELALRRRPATEQAAAEFDVLLSDGVLRYARDLREGRAELRASSRDTDLPREPFDAAAALGTALKENRLADFLEQLAPPHQAYRGLKKALAGYREISAKGDWPDIGNGFRDWETNASQATLLRNRLALEDPVLAASAEGDLRPAIMRFQQHHALAADGRIGPRTMQALSVPASERAAQIAANMERWRWVPRSFGPRYILVNSADAALVLVDRGKVVLTSRVIVGKPATPTAIFGARVTDVTVNPSWNIPQSIVRNEILPKARRNPHYLANNHIVSDGEGGYRQLPGADNALGRIKFEMPNRFSMYLHDTSAPALFSRDERHLSHGCIRVEQIRALGSFALTGDPKSGLEKIDAAVGSGETQRFALDKPLPVYVLYWTAIANEDGTVDFPPDIYGRDQELFAALAGRHLIGRVTMNYDTECRKA